MLTQKVNPKITISGFDIEWDLEKGINLWAGFPTLSMWIGTTTAGMMAGFQRMVGEDRFNLCMQIGGLNSVEGDWSVIASRPTFEEGLQLLSDIAWPAGWGRWQLVSLDRDKKEARYRATNSWEGLYQRALGVCWGSGMIAGKFAGFTSRVFGTPCWSEQVRFMARGDEYDEFVVTESAWTPQQRLDRLLHEGKASNVDLVVALQKLQHEVQERERTERELRDKLELIRRQEETLRTLAVPIVQVWDGVLMVPLMGSLDSERAGDVMERLLQEIVSARARFAILDLTAVDHVDTSTANHLVRIVRAVDLLGARVVVTGIRSAVAQAMVGLGMDLSSMTTLRNLQEGLRACMRWRAEEEATSHSSKLGR